VCAHRGLPDVALPLLDRMHRLQIAPSALCWRHYLCALIRAGRVQYALAQLHQVRAMKHTARSPSIYFAMLKAMAASTSSASSSSSSSTVSDCPISTASLRVMQFMRDDGYQVPASVYTNLIQALVNENLNNSSAASTTARLADLCAHMEELMQLMRAQGLHPEPLTYELAIEMRLKYAQDMALSQVCTKKKEKIVDFHDSKFVLFLVL
jgi:hypothetical protein